MAMAFLMNPQSTDRGLKLWCGPTRDVLLPSSIAKARPHGHCIRSAAAASHRRKYHVQPPWLRAAARTRPRRELADQRRSTRAHCGPPTSIVVWANSRATAPPQLYGHGSAARPPHQVGGCGFEPSKIQRSAPLAARGCLLAAPSRTGRPPKEHARELRTADFSCNVG